MSIMLPAAPAQQSEVKVSATATPDSITVGDRVAFTVTVDHVPGVTFEWPERPDKMGQFEVLGFRVLDSLVTDGRVQSRAQYELTVFELGVLEIPPLGIPVGAADSSGEEVIETDALKVTVSSVGVADSADIRGIKPPLGIPRYWWLLAPWIAALLALAAIIYWLIRRRMRRDRGDVPAVAPLLPHELAYQALDRLESSPLLEQGEIKRYFIEASEIVRVYIEGRFGVMAMEMTSYDVLLELESHGVGRRELDALEDFLRRADLVKFAKHRPSPDLCQALVPAARRFVDETKESSDAQQEPELVGAKSDV